jgi:hypothetical protein
LEQFRHAYRAVQNVVPVDDLISGTGNVHALKLDDAESGGESDEEGNSNTHLSTGQWIESSYANPLRLIWQLSSYPVFNFAENGDPPLWLSVYFSYNAIYFTNAN